MEFIVLGFLLTCAIFGIIASIITPEGQKGTAFALGALLGPIGIIIAAIIGNRAAADARHQRELLARSTPRPAAPAEVSPLADVPDTLTIRRNGEIIGTWSLEETLSYLQSGHLLPTDHYLANPTTNRWALLRRLI